MKGFLLTDSTSRTAGPEGKGRSPMSDRGTESTRAAEPRHPGSSAVWLHCPYDELCSAGEKSHSNTLIIPMTLYDLNEILYINWCKSGSTPPKWMWLSKVFVIVFSNSYSTVCATSPEIASFYNSDSRVWFLPNVLGTLNYKLHSECSPFMLLSTCSFQLTLLFSILFKFLIFISFVLNDAIIFASLLLSFSFCPKLCDYKNNFNLIYKQMGIVQQILIFILNISLFSQNIICACSGSFLH